MKRTTLLSLALLTTVALGACGGSSDPAVLQVSGAPAADARAAGGANKMTAEAAASGASDAAMSMIAPAYLTTYEWTGGDLPSAGQQARAYRLKGVDRAAVEQLAKALGVEGDVVEQDGAFVVGPQDGTGRSLWVSSTGQPWFSYSDATAVQSVTSCAEPAVVTEEAADGTTSSDGTASSDAGVSAEEQARLDQVCEPQPLQNLPSGEEAEAKARDILTAAGIDLDSVTFTVDASEWGVWVNAVPAIDGMKVMELSASVGFGENAQITYVGGWLGGIEEADEYPLVSGEQAFEFLKAGELWGPQPAVADVATMEGGEARTGETLVGGDAVAPAPADAAATDGAAAEGSEGAAAGGEATPPAEGTGEAAVTVEPMPAPEDIEPMVVRLNGVRSGLQMFVDASGAAWLLPSYVFTDADGGEWNVLAVERQFLAAD